MATVRVAPIKITKVQKTKIKSTEKRIAKIVGTVKAKKYLSAAIKNVKAGKKDIKDLL